jgi:hypothetical protein
MSWEQVKKARDEIKKSNFINLKDGDSVVGVFRGEPYCFYKEKYPSQSKVEYDEYQPGRTFRFRINFIVNDGENYSARIFEGNKETSDALYECYEEKGLDAVYKIKRKGSQQLTKYYITFQSALSGGPLEKIKSIQVAPLRFGGKAKAQVFDNQEPPMHTDRDAPLETDDEDNPPF